MNNKQEKLERFAGKLRLYAGCIVWSQPGTVDQHCDELDELLKAADEEKLFKLNRSETKRSDDEVSIRRHILLGDRAAVLADISAYLKSKGVPKKLIPKIKTTL